MNALVKTENTALAAITETELLEVLQSSLYPGAKLASIKLVLGYCKAAGLDPMKKPVHLVPMKVATGQLDDNGYPIKEMRDVIMPGVGLYRTEAARTGQYTGMGEPEYGPTKTLKYQATKWVDRKRVSSEADIEYPEWARVTVQRTINGIPCTFAAKEYWLENYATQSADSAAPNAMWLKRPFGQLGKCAEAQALRKAFPDTTGSQPTAEEMEGRGDENGEIKNMGAADVVHTPAQPEKTHLSTAEFDKHAPTWKKVMASGKAKADDVIAKVNAANPKAPLSEEQVKTIRAMEPKAPEPGAAAAPAQLTHSEVLAKLEAAQTEDELNTVMDLASGLTFPDAERAQINAAYDSRLTALRG